MGDFRVLGFYNILTKLKEFFFFTVFKVNLCHIYGALTMRNHLLGVIIIVLLVWVSFLLQETVKNAANSEIYSFFIIFNFEKCV